MDLTVKNMVCMRCVRVVREELEKVGFSIGHVELGRVEILDHEVDLEHVASILQANGFELLEDKTAKLIELVKTTLIDFIYSEQIEHFEGKVSDLLQASVGKEYSSISSLFSSIEGLTIEKYFISQKIARAKELMTYDELNLSEIAFKLGYSSVQHFSNQFRKCTGMSPSKFKEIHQPKRIPLDNL